jgi:hypothetical protein
LKMKQQCERRSGALPEDATRRRARGTGWTIAAMEYRYHALADVAVPTVGSRCHE